VLFEVEARKAAGRATLFVIDDLADSFDYKNKYAIIQYLKEIVNYSDFKIILLTHNFDFFRTVKSDGVVFLPFVETSSVMASGTGTCLVL